MIKELLFVLLICSIAAADSSTAVNQKVQPCLMANETFTKTFHAIGGDGYYFVAINGTESLVFAAEGARLVESESELRALLLQELSEANVTKAEFLPNETEKDRIWGYMLAFNSSRDMERECARLTGIDRFPCYDLETCWRACYTPACQEMKIGSGAVFLGFLQEIYANITFIDKNLSEFRERLYGLSPNETDGRVREGLEGMLLNVQGIRKAGGDLESNPIQLAYSIGFCYPMDYKYNGLINASASVARVRDTLMPLLAVNETASLLHNRTLARIAMKEANLARPLCTGVKANAEVELLRTKADANHALSLISSEEIVSKARQMDEMYLSLDCENSSSQEIQSFNSSFFSLSAELDEAALRGISAYEGAAQKLGNATAQLTELQSQAPDDAGVKAAAASIVAIDSRLKALPTAEELMVINSELDASLSEIGALEARIGPGQPQFGMIVAVAALLIIIALAAFLALRRPQGRRRRHFTWRRH